MSEREMARLIAILQKALGKAWVDSSEWVREQHSIADIAARIERGQPIDALIEDIRQAAARFAAESNHAYSTAGRTAAQSLDAKVDGKLIRFDVENERAVQRARQNAWELREGIAQEQRQIIQRRLVEGVTRGENPRVTARDIRDSIGLTDYQERIVANYRRELESGQFANASARELVGGRDTRSLVAASNRGEPLSQKRIDELVGRYRENWIDYRAETIARTESARAANEGSADLYKQAIARGDVDADELVKTWHAGPKTRHARDDHRAMDGNSVALNDDFVLPDGTRMAHPGDPRGGVKHIANCRCTSSVTYRARRAAA